MRESEMEPLRGTLHFHCPEKCIGTWVFIPENMDTEKCITLKSGDHLTVYASKSRPPIFSDTITLCEHEPYTKTVMGYYVVSTPEGTREETWASWFFGHHYAELIPA